MADPVVDVGAPPAADGSASTFLGVPNNYVFNPPDNVISKAPDPVSQMLGFVATSAQQPPRYKSGDELALASMPPETIARMQSALATVGLIGPSTTIHVGLADSATVSAFKALMTYANVNGQDWQTSLSQLAANPPVKASTSTTMPNPVNEDNALYSAARSLFGHDPTQAQLDGFRPYYNSTLTTQPQTTDMIGSVGQPDIGSTTSGDMLAGTSTTTVAPLNVDDAAQQFLRQTAPGEVAAQQVATKYQTLMKILGGSGS